MQSEGLKTHLSKVSDDYAPKVNHEQDRATGICAPGSTVHSEFRTPPAVLPLSGGGGSGIRGAPLQRLRLARPDQRL